MIMDKNIDPGASIGIDKLGFPNIISGTHTDGSLPKIIWVAKGGADAAGATGVSKQGSRNEPFLTIGGASGALAYTVDGRGDRIIVGPGIWRENLDFGSGTGTTGSAGRLNKRDIGLYGSGGGHPGRIQIVGDGTTVGPTIRVRDGYLRGFALADVEVGSVDSDDADRAQPLVLLETSDTATLTANSSDEWAMLRNVRLDGGATATIGLALRGTTGFRAYGLEVVGCGRGVAFAGSADNFPVDCRLYDVLFLDNVTSDVATLAFTAAGAITSGESASVPLTNVTFVRPLFMDRGGTPVTNYVNMTGTMVGVGFYEFVAARDVADDTLMVLPVDVIAIGRSAAAAEFVIGA